MPKKKMTARRFWKTCKDHFQPAILDCFREGYTRKTFISDCIAGLIVAAVALPLAIAFSIAAGLPPQAGMITAVVAGFAISALGGCRVQIGGPTGAFIVIIYGIYSQFGSAGLMAATLMAGVILIIMGICGLGSIIKYIPYPVTVGFTSGIALIIFAGQIEALFGLDCREALKTLAYTKMPGDFIGKLNVYAHAINTFHWAAALIAAITIVIGVYWKKVTQRVPGSIIAILVTTLLAMVMKHFGIEVATIGSQFPEVAGGMSFSLPELDWTNVELRELVSPAISIALLAGIESLLSAVVADGMIGRRHNSNTELIGQGIANILSPLCGGIPATGAIARTATNIKNGGKTPMAGILHALFLLLIMLFLGKYAALIPMATLAGVVAIVAYNMSEWHLVKGLFKSTASDVLVMMTSFFLTVIVDLTVAIQAGVLLAAFLFIRRMSETTGARDITRFVAANNGPSADDIGQPGLRPDIDIPKGVEVFEIYGALFFGAADKFKDTLLSHAHRVPKVLILRMRHVLMLDATALHSLEEVFEHTRARGVTLVLSGVTSQPLVIMVRSGFLDKIGEANVHGHIIDAVARARDILAEENSPTADPHFK